jgi:hypothetical protein
LRNREGVDVDLLVAIRLKLIRREAQKGGDGTTDLRPGGDGDGCLALVK